MSGISDAYASHDLASIDHAVPADQHPAAVYIARLAPGSRRTMREALDTIAGILSGEESNAELLPWHLLHYQHTQAVRVALAERYAPATANKMLAALRGVLKESWRLGQMNAEDYTRAIDLETVKGTTLPRGRALQHGEIGAILAACCVDGSPAGYRDAAIFALLYAAGLRRSEIAALDLNDVDVETGELRIRAAKGHKDRTVYANNGSLDALADWLKVRGDEPGPLFCPINKGGRLLMQQMTPQVVRFMLVKRAKQAGVKDCSPHDLRRTFIGDLLDSGADIVTVQHMAGHSNVQTTARYDRRGEAAKKKAAHLLHVPYLRAG